MRRLSRVYPLPGIKLRIGRGNGPRRDPQNRVEGIHWIEAAVETKHEFIEVSLQMTRFDPSMVSAVNPCLQIGENKMDHRQVLFRLLWVAPKGKCIVPIAHCGKVAISIPSISANDRVRRYIVFDKCCERFGISVCSMLEITRSRRRPA
jgi:hypothetical protein